VRQGQPLLNKLAAFFGDAVVKNPTKPQATPHVAENEPKLSAYIEEGAIKLRSTDAYGDPMRHASNLAVRVIIGEATASKLVAGELNAANDWEIPVPGLAAGQHIMSCRIVSNSPKYLGEASVLVV